MATFIKRMRPLLGTFVEIQIPVEMDSDSIFAASFNKIDQVEKLCNFHSPTSELSKLNGQSNKWITLSEITLDILSKSIELMDKSHHLFNITIGRELQNKKILPLHPGQEKNNLKGMSDDIQIKENSCKLRRPLSLTLDGIAKGYAVDLAIEELKKNQVPFGLVNAGGDLRVFGNHDFPLYRRDYCNNVKLIGTYKDMAMATSNALNTYSSSHRGYIFNNKFSKKKKIWTVISKETWRADALTKVATLVNDSERLDLIKKLGGTLV